MASYKELYVVLWHESDLKNRVIIAVIVAAETIHVEDPETPNHANRLAWATQALENPLIASDAMFRLILAANKDATIEAILAVLDPVIQFAVDAAVDMFATGG